ncbi:MAG: hypothetical protein J7M25_18435 [Deltaproteobacteria bacterium]|nr:hypothetical protein [Deltaproteobacteria bacterium]
MGETTCKESSLFFDRWEDLFSRPFRTYGHVGIALLAVAGLLLQGGCRGCGHPAHRNRLTLVVHMGAEPPHLNPLIQEDMWLKRIVTNNVFETLIRRDPKTYRLKPNLARKWTLSVDGRTLDLWLRSGVHWHDGQAFGPKDVLFTFDRLMDPTVTAGSARAAFVGLQSWKQVGPNQVRLRFSKSTTRVLEALAYLDILPRHIYGRGDLNHLAANDRPVGTGPFRFDRWKRGEFIRLRRNESYWGRKPAITTVLYRVIRSRQKAFELARAGKIDLLPRILPRQACGVDAPARQPVIAKQYRLVVFYPVQYHSIIINFKNPIFSDRRVRQALAMLLNRKLIADKIYCGFAKVISGPYWIGGASYDHHIAPWPYDPQRAAALLAQAGWRDTDGDGILDRQGKPFRFVYLRIAESAMQAKLIPLFREAFRKAGLDMQVHVASWPDVLAKLRHHQFDMVDLNWVSDYGQDLFQLYHSSQCNGGSNYGCYRNAEVDRLLEQARQTRSPKERHAIERKIHGLLHQDLPGIFLFNGASISLVSRRFAGLEPSAEWFSVRDARPVQGAK